MKTVGSQTIMAIQVLVSCLAIDCQSQIPSPNSLHTYRSDTAISNAPPHKVVFEMLGGPGITMFYGAKEADKIPYWRYTLALGSSIRLSKKLDVDVKLLWEAKGIKTEWWGYASEIQQRVRYIQGQELTYVSMGLGLSYYVDCERRLFINGGIGVSRLINKWSYTYQYDENGNLLSTYRGDAQNSFKNFDLGLTCSIGYRRAIFNHTMVTTQLFGNLGLVHVYRDSQHYEGSIRNANVALMIGIGIGHH